MQEVERAHGITVTSIVALDDVVTYLAERPEYAVHLEAMWAYRGGMGLMPRPRLEHSHPFNQHRHKRSAGTARQPGSGSIPPALAAARRTRIHR